MRRWTMLTLLALLVLSFTAGARAQEPDYESAHKAAVGVLVKSLESLADWCNSKDLFAERDRVWRAIIDLDTNNAAARKGLRYGRNTDGTWLDPAPRESKNRNAQALEELPARRKAALDPFRTALFALIDKEDADSPRRRAVYNEIIAVDPDDEVVHALRGEKRLDDDKWALEETWQGKARRAQIKELAATALKSVPAAHKLEPTTEELALGVRWKTLLATDTVRVLSTGDEEEAARVLQLTAAAGSFFRGVLDCPTGHRPGWTTYLLVNEGEQSPFLANLAGLTPSFREFLGRVVGVTIPNRPEVVYWDHDMNHRIDGASRQTIQDFLNRTFGITMDQGWAWEGFGLYLNRELSGLRLTWFIQLNGADRINPLKARLMVPDANWMNEALTLLGSNDHPKFAALLENDVNTMGIADMLYAYAFAAYMLEGRPKDTPEILRRIGLKKEKTANAMQAVLHLSLTQIEERVYRWLSERK